MGEFFGTLYTMCGLENLYGIDLADYLWGYASSQETANQFISIGLATLVIAAIITAIYYYVFGTLLSKPSWGNKLTWVITLAVNSAIAFIVGWSWTLSDLYGGKMVTVDPTTSATIDLPIDAGNCLGFGVVNVIVALLFFLIFTVIFKWKSRDYSRVPF